MYAERTLNCVDCAAEFPFSPEEQEFYASKGFNEPRRCKTCRSVKKQRNTGGGGGGGGGGFSRGPREMHDAVCAACGAQTQVPFKPDGRKPVYCRQCF